MSRLKEEKIIKLLPLSMELGLVGVGPGPSPELARRGVMKKRLCWTLTIRKTLHVKDGRLGFVTANGFISATNFNIDIESQVSSLHYSIKSESFRQINSYQKIIK